MIILTKTLTTMAKMSDDFKWTIKLTDQKYWELCKQYGTYSVDWYFTETGSIKHFDGEEWHYESSWR